MEWLLYLLKVSVCTGLFYSFYHLFLRKLTFFNSNRIYLITTLFLSLIIPALRLDYAIPEKLASQPSLDTNYVDGATGLTVSKDTYQLIYSDNLASSAIKWEEIITFSYLIVAAGMLSFFAIQIARLLFQTKNVSRRIGKMKIIVKPNGFTNCSFLNYVFVDQENLSKSEMQVLLHHESIHVLRYHSVDKMLTAICKIFLWFNPFVYLYEQALDQLHEYEADRDTSEVIGAQTYARLLLAKATIKSDTPFLNHFVKSPLKERIVMLFTSHSKSMKKLIYFSALPLLATLLWGFSVEYVTQIENADELVKDSSVYRQKIKRTPQMIGSKKEFEEWRNTDAYKSKVRAMELVAGKSLTGLVKLNTKPDRTSSEISMLFISDNVTYTLMLGDNPERIKDILTPNSTITVKVHVPSFAMGADYIELRAGSIIYEGKEIYHMKPSTVPPFLFEVNKVRFADGKVNKVMKTGSNTKELEILANGYVFLLKVNSNQVALAELDAVKVGDDLRFRFVHEIKTNVKAYLIKDWVSISEDIRSYGIKNKELFNFYYEKVEADKISYTAKDSVISDTTNKIVQLFGNATLKYKSFSMVADQIYFNYKDSTGFGKHLKGRMYQGKPIIVNHMDFDLKGF